MEVEGKGDSSNNTADTQSNFHDDDDDEIAQHLRVNIIFSFHTILSAFCSKTENFNIFTEANLFCH